MIHRETPNFKASLYAPNPIETSYWIDLKEGPDGQVIKTFDGKEWVRVNDILNDEQTAEIEALKERCTDLENNKLDKTAFNEYVEEATEIHEQLDEQKADKATTLAGYGITDAYTKNETDSKINTAVADLVNQAPEVLDTLDELAQALGDDPNFATTMATQLSQKVNISDYNSDKATFATKTELATKLDKATADTYYQPIGDYLTAVPEEYVTETELNAKGYATTTQLNTKVTGSGVTGINVVTELPEQQNTGVLYIVIPQTA